MVSIEYIVLFTSICSVVAIDLVTQQLTSNYPSKWLTQIWTTNQLGFKSAWFQGYPFFQTKPEPGFVQKRLTDCNSQLQSMWLNCSYRFSWPSTFEITIDTPSKPATAFLSTQCEGRLPWRWGGCIWTGGFFLKWGIDGTWTPFLWPYQCNEVVTIGFWSSKFWYIIVSQTCLSARCVRGGSIHVWFAGC